MFCSKARPSGYFPQPRLGGKGSSMIQTIDNDRNVRLLGISRAVVAAVVVTSMVFALSGGAVAQVASVPSDADQGDGLEVENAKRFFDMERDNAMRDILLPHVVSWLQADVSPGLNDASILFRYFTTLFNVAFDAVAPYHETAVGVYSRLERRPSWESVNNRRPNVAVMYAVYHSMIEFAPHRTEHWRRMMTLRGLDPDASTEDQSTPAGHRLRGGEGRPRCPAARRLQPIR